MIDKSFWEKVSQKWIKKTDGIDLPPIQDDNVASIDPELVPFEDLTDEAINDILSDLGF